jgi:hypothetical protein
MEVSVKNNKLLIITAVYTIVYALISFVLIVSFFFMIIASRGIWLFSPLIALPFFTGFLYFVGLVLSLLCLNKEKSKWAFPYIAVIIFIYFIEALALLLPIFALKYVAKYISIIIISVPVTKILLVILAILILILSRIKKRKQNDENAIL